MYSDGFGYTIKRKDVSYSSHLFFYHPDPTLDFWDMFIRTGNIQAGCSGHVGKVRSQGFKFMIRM